MFILFHALGVEDTISYLPKCIGAVCCNMHGCINLSMQQKIPASLDLLSLSL